MEFTSCVGGRSSRVRNANGEGNGTTLQYSCLENPMDWGAWKAACSPWGRWGSDTTERLHFHFSHSCIGEGNGNPLQCSCLENPRDGGAWWAAIHGVTQSHTQLKWLSSSSSSRNANSQVPSRANKTEWKMAPHGSHLLGVLEDVVWDWNTPLCLQRWEAPPQEVGGTTRERVPFGNNASPAYGRTKRPPQPRWPTSAFDTDREAAILATQASNLDRGESPFSLTHPQSVAALVRSL